MGLNFISLVRALGSVCCQKGSHTGPVDTVLAVFFFGSLSELITSSPRLCVRWLSVSCLLTGTVFAVFFGRSLNVNCVCQIFTINARFPAKGTSPLYVLFFGESVMEWRQRSADFFVSNAIFFCRKCSWSYEAAVD